MSAFQAGHGRGSYRRGHEALQCSRRERTMKEQEVILHALAKRISWWQAAEIVGLSDRQMRRWGRRYEA
jgi:hypothetical protein